MWLLYDAAFYLYRDRFDSGEVVGWYYWSLFLDHRYLAKQCMSSNIAVDAPHYNWDGNHLIFMSPPKVRRTNFIDSNLGEQFIVEYYAFYKGMSARNHGLQMDFVYANRDTNGKWAVNSIGSGP